MLKGIYIAVLSALAVVLIDPVSAAKLKPTKETATSSESEASTMNQELEPRRQEPIIATIEKPKSGFKAGTLAISVAASNSVPTVGLSYFLDQYGAIFFDVGLTFAIEPDFLIHHAGQVGYRMYIEEVEQLHLFVEGAVFYGLQTKNVGDNFRLGVTGAGGAEYFLGKRFSVAGKLGAGFALITGPVDRETTKDTDDIRAETFTTSLIGNFYW